MSCIKIWVHAVWTTKNRTPQLTEETKQKIINHIFQYSKSKNIHINCINGCLNHLHCLISLGDSNISKIISLIKGESSHWINKENIYAGKFEWQDEYLAVSVGESQIPIIKKYIQDQVKHHRKKTFAEEYEEFIRKYGLKPHVGVGNHSST